MTNYYNSLSFRKSSKLRNEIRNLASPRPNFISYFKKSLWIHAFLLVTLLTMNQSVWAQSSANYTFATNATGSLALDMNSNAIDMSSGTTQLVGPGLDAAASPVTNIGFDFYLMGSKFTQFSVQEDGILQLGGTVVGTNIYTITGGTANAPRLSAFNADFRTGTTSGKIHYKLVGTAPNRALIVEFTDMQLFYTLTGTAGTSTWQMRLYENGSLQYVYGTMSATDVATGNRAASIGFYTGANTGNFASVLYTTHAVSTTSPFAANANVAATGPIANLTSATNGSRRTYSFTPVNNLSPANPTSMTFTGISAGATTVNWIDSSTDETFFMLTRALDAAFTTGVSTVLVASTTTGATGGSYSSPQSGLSPSTLYYYKVVALNEAGVPLSGLLGSSTTGVPGIFISIANGNWNTPATWDVGIVPSAFDSAIISTGNAVSIDATGLGITNLTVNGTLDYGSTPTSFAISGNLTVNTGGVFNVFNGTTGKTLSVAGNIINNGTMDVSVGATTAGNLTLNGTGVQTVNGTGTFNTSVIRNLIFANTSTATPNIVWSFNNIKIAYNLNLTGARVNLGTNKITFGASAAGNTLTAPVGTGFLPGGKFSRWWTAAATGSAITAGTDPTNVTSRYPFIDVAGSNRAMYITRTNATGAVAGELAVVYNDVAGITTGLTVADGAYTVNERFNGNWSVSNEGTPVSSSSYTVVLLAQNAFSALINGNARVMYATTAIGGAHQNGTTTPGAQRITVSQADLLSAPLYVGVSSSDIPFVSITNGNWSNPTTWNKNAVPGATDVVSIASSTTVALDGANLASNVTVATGGILNASTGTLTATSLLNNGTTNVSGSTLSFATTVTNAGALNVNGGNLNVTGASTTGITNNASSTISVDGGTINLASAGANNRTFANNGTFTVISGTVNVFGNMIHNGGSTFNQSGGNITIDGNDAGSVTNSVVTGTHLLNITANAVSNLNLTGGTITIVDPPQSSGTGNYALRVSQGGAYNSASANHTFKFGNGISNDNSTAGSNGFYVYLFPGSFLYGFGNVVVDAGTTGVNRFVKTNSTTPIKNDLTITSGEYQLNNTTYLGGNLINNGILTATSTLNITDYNGAIVASTGLQSISGSGVFRNLGTAQTANLTSLTINNTNAAGVTLNIPLSLSGTLTLTSGKLNTTTTNLLTVGTATAVGTITGGGATAYVNGPLARTVASGNANTNYINYPVGKTTYAPIWLAPATTAVSNLKAETFDVNSGTTDASLLNLSATRRWEAPLVSGAITNINVRLGDASVVSTSVPAQAPTASGVYTGSFGSVATFVAGTPNTTQSSTALVGTNYTGFLSFADSNACVGTPAPGNTVASSTAICSGESVTLSLQNSTSGSGVTYVWESSADGVAYTPISGATNATYIVVPTTSTYYRAQVTCSGNTGTSTAVQVNFTNNITGTTPGIRCGTGTVQLAATANAGATIRWYDAVTGGNLVGTGSPFTTPSIASTQSFWAVAETSGPVLAGGIIAPPSDWTGATLTDWGIIFNALNAVTINSVDLYSTVAGTVNLKIVNSTGTELYSTGNVSIANGGTTTPNVVPINFSVPAGTNYKILVKSYTGVSLVRGSTSLAFPYTNGNISITASEWGGSTTSTYYYMYNIKTTTACSSTRVPVVATVNTAPTLTLSSNPAPVCQGTQTTAVTLTAGASDYDTYVWSPSTGISGDAVAGWSFNPTATTAYTVTATNSVTGCINTATVNVTISATPSAITVVPDSPTICAGSIQQLTTTGGIVAPSIVSGTGATTSGTNATNATLGPNPLQAYYGGTKQQWIYTAAELTSLGFVANTRINAIKLDLATANTTYALNNLVVKMKNSPTASFATTTSWETGLTTVRAASSYTPVVGANTFTLDAPFTWNGTDNLVIEMNYSNNNGGTTTAYNTAKHSPTSFVSTIYYRADSQTATAVNTFVGTASYTYSSRSDVAFDVIAPTTWSSTGTGDLFTDAAATIPYVSGNAATIVYAKPSATATYTATATLGTCTSTDSSVITVTSNTVPNFAEIGSICQGSVAPTLATTSPNGVVGTWAPATVSNTANGSYVFTPNTGQCAVTQTLNVTVNTTAAPTGDATQYGTTLADLVVSPTTGITWYASEADALASTNELPLTTALVDGATYYATQTTTCESVPFAVTIDFDLKTPSFNMNSLKYYPNPVSNVLTVTYSEAITGLKLYNMVGQQLMSKSVNSNETQLDMSHLPAGSYLLEITAGTKSKMVKLLKNQ